MLTPTISHGEKEKKYLNIVLIAKLRDLTE